MLSAVPIPLLVVPLRGGREGGSQGFAAVHPEPTQIASTESGGRDERGFAACCGWAWLALHGPEGVNGAGTDQA